VTFLVFYNGNVLFPVWNESNTSRIVRYIGNECDNVGIDLSFKIIVQNLAK